jgi:hypothetical protein
MVKVVNEFSTVALATIDGGRVAAAINQELKKAALDCDDRPGESRPRKIVVEILMVPVADETGLADSVKLACKIKASHPDRRSRVFDMSLRKGGKLAYDEESLDNVDQQTLDFKSS